MCGFYVLEHIIIVMIYVHVGEEHPVVCNAFVIATTFSQTVVANSEYWQVPKCEWLLCDLKSCLSFQIL